MRVLIKITVRNLDLSVQHHRSDHRSVLLRKHSVREWRRTCHGGFERMLRMYWRRTLSGAYTIRPGLSFDE